MSPSLTLSVSADKCKRRWRQIRNDYVRWISSDNQRQRNGQKRPGFYLADELQFLNPHLSGVDRERDSPESERGSERDSKSKSKESAIEEYKGKQKDIDESVEEQPLAKLKQTAKDKELEKEKDKDKEKDKEKEKDKDKEKEKEKEKTKDKVKEKDQAKEKAADKRAEKEQKSRSEDSATPTTPVDSPVGSSKQEFFIKQNNNNNLSNCLIIGVKPAGSSASDSPLLDPMADDSGDETASMGGGRRLRRSANRIKNPTIQRSAAEQRLTRLQRRKSMTMAAANSLMSSTSPVKMTPVPRASMPASSANANASAGQPKASSKAPAKHALAGARDDIFPRPRAAAPVNQQVVLARHPGMPLQMPPKLQPPQGVQAMQPRQTYGVGRPPGPARLAANAQAKRLLAGAAPPGPRPNFAGRPPAPLNDNFKSPVTSSAPTSQAQAQAQLQQPLQPQRIVSSSNTLVISTTNNSTVNSSNSISSMANMASMANFGSFSANSSSTPSSSFATQTASITASPIVSTTPPTMALIKRCERGSQTECQDIFSDEHFLEMVRPQMKEMNPRQKMHFKQKIFQALIEIFDDATDFPASGEVQHFNINTPSGFDHVSDGELRLIRELVSMVGAAKHTAGMQVPATASKAMSNSSSSSSSSSSMSSLTQRVSTPKTPNVAQNIIRPTMTTTPLSDEKKLYRIMKMNNQSKIVSSASPLTDHRKDSVDSISSSCTIPLTSSSARNAKFAVPGVGVKPVTRPLDPLNQLFGQGGKPVAGSAISPKEPILVRQMGRRYSVCGGGGPTNSLGAHGVNANNTNIDVAVLKRRIPPIAQPMAAPAQRPRYSPNSQPSANPMAAIPPGNSLLMRRANVNVSGGQRQATPMSAVVTPQKTPQIASIQGNAFNEFATPTAVRGASSSSSAGISPAISPIKRAMIVANAKNTAQSKPATTLAPASGQAKSASQSPGSNVANLLAEPRPEVPSSDMAGIIAADDFDMERLKREPLDPDDPVDDILGI